MELGGDPLAKVYELYSREIFAYLCALSGSVALAEDLTQETFLKALLSLDDSHKNVRAWLYAVARNLYYDRARRAGFEIPEENPESGFAEGPEDELQRKALRNELRSALMRLDERKREVILLQYFSGLSVREIASVTGLSQENVRVLAFRAKKELKRFLEENDEIR